MNRRLRIAAIMIVLMSAWALCFAQQTHTVAFAYDLDGNRIHREIVFGRMEGNERNGEWCEKYQPTVTDFFETMEVDLYPNPTKDRFFVEIKGRTDNHAEAVLTLVSGTVLETRIITRTSESFDLSNMPPGIYFLKLTVDKDTHIWKVVKKQ